MEAELAKRTAEEFDKRHGGNPIVDENRCWLYFPDGCYREVNPLGARIVPKDPYRRAGFAVAYYQAKLELAIDEFSRLRQNLLARTNAAKNPANPASLPNRQTIQRLKDLKKKVNAAQKELERAQQQREDLKPETLRQREEANENLMQEADKVSKEIKAIEI